MTLHDFALMAILGREQAQVLLASILNSTALRVVGVWDAKTGFCVQAVVENGKALRYFATGPCDRDEARALLLSDDMATMSEAIH